MLDAIPGLINAIRMIHSISRYYNTSERMTALFVKVTNQMITASKQYIYEKEPRIWEQNKEELCTKLAQASLFCICICPDLCAYVSNPSLLLSPTWF